MIASVVPIPSVGGGGSEGTAIRRKNKQTNKQTNQNKKEVNLQLPPEYL